MINDFKKIDELTEEYLALLREKGSESMADFYEKNHSVREGKEKFEIEELNKKIIELKNKKHE